MKTIVLVLVLAAMGCSKKASSDCDAPINKGMDNFSNTVKSRGSNAPMQGAMLEVIGKLRTTFMQRCHDDKWAPEVATCFGTVASQADVKGCEAKLTDEQRTKLTNQVREIMMSSMRMPNMAGHPQMLQGSAAPAMGSGAAPGSDAAPAAGSGAAPAAGSAAPAAGSGSAAAGGW